MKTDSMRDFRIFFTIAGALLFLFAGFVLIIGLNMLGRQQLRAARAALPQVREDFTLMQPHLNTLRNAFPGRWLDIHAPEYLNGGYSPLSIRHEVLIMENGRLIRNSYNYIYEDWYTLDWFPQDAIDATVFLMTSPYLSYPLNEIWIGYFGSDDLIAYVGDSRYPDPVHTMIFYHSRPDFVASDIAVMHQEALDNGYFLRINRHGGIARFMGLIVSGFGAVGVFGGGILLGVAFFIRDRKVLQNPDISAIEEAQAAVAGSNYPEDEILTDVMNYGIGRRRHEGDD